MAIEYFIDEIEGYERGTSKPYNGFFSPKGKLVDYNTVLGGTDDNLGNIVSWTFLLWVKQSKALRSYGIDINTRARLYEDTGEIEGVLFPIPKYRDKNLIALQNSLMEFLRIAEHDKNFMNSLKKIIDKSKIPEYVTKDKKIPMGFGYRGAESCYEIEAVFGCENTKNLLAFLKRICVQYLGYDSIEKYKPNGEEITLPSLYFYYPDDHQVFFNNPRTILSSYSNPNERFFNYFAMNWTVRQLPKYTLNKRTGEYEPVPDNISLLESKDEEMYKKELESMKRLVPLNERHKYFIK